MADEELESFVLGDRFDLLIGDDEHFVDYAQNAAFLTSGLSEEVFAKGSVTSYAYDDFARLAQKTTPIDGNLNNVVKYTYDPVADLAKQETSIGNVSATRSPRRRAA